MTAEALGSSGVGMRPATRPSSPFRFEALGGQLHLESTPGHGTTLHATLPRAGEQSGA
jgi:signal transduction histidine kinase